jgi:hypothetical protein
LAASCVERISGGWMRDRHDYFHAIVDDHSRLAYGELLS